MTRNANWDLAEHLFKVMLPEATSITIDGLPETPMDTWKPFDIENRDINTVRRDLLSRCSHLVGPVIVVNDASYGSEHGPHFIEASRLNEFAENFSKNFNDAFISGRMVIAAPVTGEVIAVDDEGLIAHIKGRPALLLAPHYSEDRSA